VNGPPCRTLADDDRNSEGEAAKRFIRGRPLACPKCSSTYIRHEPAFVHCRLCGKIARIADASLGDQELYERQAGLRLAC
jgi:hypothetical protein